MNKLRRHAYLIIANRNPHQLDMLLSALDDSRNDIFILLDKKSEGIFPAKLKINFSNVTKIDPIDIYWGDYSLIEAEMSLFKAASVGKYNYYHLLSGLDLPLVNQDTIHSFFDEHPNQEFITYSNVFNKQTLSMRLHNYHFRKSFRTDNKFMKIYHKFENRVYSKIPQHRVDVNDIDFGSNWVSLDHELVCDLIKNEDIIYKLFHNGFLVDELFIPIFINLNPKYKEKVFYSKGVTDKPKEFQGNLRYINWWDGDPYVWKRNDYDRLQHAVKLGYMFSRKFDERIDKDIIEKIINEVTK